MTGKIMETAECTVTGRHEQLACIPSLSYLEEQVAQELNRRLPVPWVARC